MTIAIRELPGLCSLHLNSTKESLSGTAAPNRLLTEHPFLHLCAVQKLQSANCSPVNSPHFVHAWYFVEYWDDATVNTEEKAGEVSIANFIIRLQIYSSQVKRRFLLGLLFKNKQTNQPKTKKQTQTKPPKPSLEMNFI